MAYSIRNNPKMFGVSAMIAFIIAAPLSAYASEWSGEASISRLADFPDRIQFDLASPYICGSGYEYTLTNANTNFAAIVQTLTMADEASLPINVEYSGTGCGKIVESVTLPQ